MASTGVHAAFRGVEDEESGSRHQTEPQPIDRDEGHVEVEAAAAEHEQPGPHDGPLGHLRHRPSASYDDVPLDGDGPARWSLGVLNDKKTIRVPGSVLLLSGDRNRPLGTRNIPARVSHSSIATGALPGMMHAPEHADGSKRTPDGRIILEPQPEESANDPLNWPTWRRDMALGSLGIYCMVGGGLTPILAAGFRNVAADYHVNVDKVPLTTGLYMMGMAIGSVVFSPTAILYGKRPVYLASAILLICCSAWCALSPSFASLVLARIFQGIAVSPVECLPSATIAEIFFLHERAFRIGIYTLLLLGGKNLVPLVSAVVIEDHGWRWVFWIVAIVVAFCGTLLFLFVPETFWDRAPVPRSRRRPSMSRRASSMVPVSPHRRSGSSAHTGLSGPPVLPMPDFTVPRARRMSEGSAGGPSSAASSKGPQTSSAASSRGLQVEKTAPVDIELHNLDGVDIPRVPSPVILVPFGAPRPRFLAPRAPTPTPTPMPLAIAKRNVASLQGAPELADDQLDGGGSASGSLHARFFEPHGHQDTGPVTSTRTSVRHSMPGQPYREDNGAIDDKDEFVAYKRSVTNAPLHAAEFFTGRPIPDGFGRGSAVSGAPGKSEEDVVDRARRLSSWHAPTDWASSSLSQQHDGYTPALRNRPAKTFAEQLKPWHGRLNRDNWFKVMVRPFVLFTYPAVLWSSAVYSCSIGWLIVVSESVAVIYGNPASYDFSPVQIGLVYIAAFVGGVLGTAVAGKVSDFIVQAMAARNGGLYEPEFRLVMALPIALTTAAGLMGLGWSAADRDAWIVPTIFFGLLSFGCSLGSTTAITFCVDSYRQYAGEALVTLNFSKNIFHGLVFSLFVTGWIDASGPRTVYLWLGVIHLIILTTSIPMYIFGKRARMWTVRKNFMEKL